MGAYLPDTVVQRTRAFLRETGMEAPPWLGAREVVERVADLFVERRAMDGDRARLRSFLEGLAAHARDRRGGDRLAAVDAEVLLPDEVAEVIETLSRTLTEGDRWTAIDGLLQALSAPAACALLLLGIAAGCGTDGGTGSDAYTGRDIDPREATAAELVQVLEAYIDDSGLSSTKKADLKECVRSRFVTGQRADLVSIFTNMSPEQIAMYLEAMLWPGHECYTAPAKDVYDPMPVDVYKGVSFPVRR